MKSVVLVALLVGIAAGSAMGEAGKYNARLKIGDPAPVFEALPGTDGKKFSTADFAMAKVLVVVFTCNSCPYAVDYEERLNGFYAKYVNEKPGDAASRVRLVAINSNLIPADSLDQMRARAEQRGFRFPYLLDASQTVAPAFGAVRTPEVYVLNADRKIVYMGAWDDNTNPALVKHHYVEDAVQATLQDMAVTTAETPPVGCLIRLKRKR